jgi:capsular exopolysaccharide synthesis family protein
MTLSDYLKVFRHRWLAIAACTLVAAAVMWVVTPAHPDTAPKASSYTATATLVAATTDDSRAPMARIALYLKTGEIPRRAAAKLGYQGDPAVLASGLQVTPEFDAEALTVAATAADGDRAAAVANAFADETVAFFSKRQPGTGAVSVSILQEATPIPNVTGGGFVIPPSRNARTALAGGLGLLLGLGLALVLDRVDSRLRTRDQISAALRLPIIAEVPRLRRAQRRHRQSIGVAEQPLSPYADSYRAARTAIVHTASQVAGEGIPRASSTRRTDSPSEGSLVLVTSAHPGEGKTTSVANLAASFAEAGQRVLVLDADLRSPDTHVLFDVPQGAGISDYLSRPDDSSLEALIRPTSIPGVRIITAGTRLEHPASLASRMGRLLSEARTMADVVLIDTAPLLAASDVFDVLPMVDTVLLVVRAGRLTDTAGHRVSELLGRFQVPVSGVVIVAGQTKHPRGYGYGYGYGYGEKKGRRSGHGLGDREAARPVDDDIETVPESRSARHKDRPSPRRKSSA